MKTKCILTYNDVTFPKGTKVAQVTGSDFDENLKEFFGLYQRDKTSEKSWKNMFDKGEVILVRFDNETRVRMIIPRFDIE